jgi:hypothetical protein
MRKEMDGRTERLQSWMSGILFSIARAENEASIKPDVRRIDNGSSVSWDPGATTNDFGFALILRFDLGLDRCYDWGLRGYLTGVGSEAALIFFGLDVFVLHATALHECSQCY